MIRIVDFFKISICTINPYYFKYYELLVFYLFYMKRIVHDMVCDFRIQFNQITCI